MDGVDDMMLSEVIYNLDITTIIIHGDASPIEQSKQSGFRVTGKKIK